MTQRDSPSGGDVSTLRLGQFDTHGTTRARWQGRSIEIEHGIPGELVAATVLPGSRPRGRIVDLIEAAPDRVIPPCSYFREWACGGCQWQMLSYESQVDRKVELIEEAMRSEGLQLTVTARHVLGDPWRYRHTAGIALGKRAGFRRHGSLAIVPIRDCPISHSLIGHFMAELNDRLDTGTIPDLRGRVRLDVQVGVGPSGDTLHVHLQRDRRRPPPEDDVRSLVNILIAMGEVSGLTDTSEKGEPRCLKGNPLATVRVGGRDVLVPAGSFFQTNLELLPRLIERIVGLSQPLDARRVADVYGGIGLFGLFMASEGATVDAVERDPVAVEAGRFTAEEWKLDSIAFREQTAEEALQAGDVYDEVIVDPPRTGLAPAVVDALVAGQPPLLLYVSCLAESLARDLVPLIDAGYTVRHLELFDFYPQTYHVEVLAVLRISDAAHSGIT